MGSAKGLDLLLEVGLGGAQPLEGDLEGGSTKGSVDEKSSPKLPSVGGELLSEARRRSA